MRWPCKSGALKAMFGTDLVCAARAARQNVFVIAEQCCTECVWHEVRVMLLIPKPDVMPPPPPLFYCSRGIEMSLGGLRRRGAEAIRKGVGLRKGRRHGSITTPDSRSEEPPPPPPTAAPPRVTIAGNNGIYKWDNAVGPFLWSSRPSGPRPPPPPPSLRGLWRTGRRVGGGWADPDTPK